MWREWFRWSGVGMGVGSVVGGRGEGSTCSNVGMGSRKLALKKVRITCLINARRGNKFILIKFVWIKINFKFDENNRI